jgi:hypothetical protein
MSLLFFKAIGGDLFPVKSRPVQTLTRPERNFAWNRPDVLSTAVLLTLIAALWLATRPYPGIVHDARFYMVQALRELDPTRFADDLYFRFGSQDQFTLFTKLYAPVVSILGIGTTGIVFTVGGQLLWVSGLLYLASGLIQDRIYAVVAAAAAIALPNTYTLFGYGESFITPRLFAEALTMLALGCLLRRRAGWAFVVLALSMTLHPLTTIPGLAITFIYLAVARPLWWVVGAGVAIVTIGLSVGAVPPFGDLRSTFDPVWFDIVKVRDAQCFVTEWPADAYCRMLATIILATLVIVFVEPSERRFVASALVIGISGLVSTLAGGDLAHNVFITEIQPWRSMWLLTVIAYLSVVSLFVRLPGSGDSAELTKLMFLTALVSLLASRFFPAAICSATPMMFVASGTAIWQGWTKKQLPSPVRAICVIAVAATCATTALFVFFGFKALLEQWPDEFRLRAYSFALVAGTLGLMISQATQVGRPTRRLARPSGLFATAAVSLALLVWDQREPWTKVVESADPIPDSLAAVLPENGSIYWEGGVELLWLRLKRPSYFSCAQGTGAVFFRETAVNFEHRAESFGSLRTLDFDISDLCPSFDQTEKLDRTRENLEAVCAREPGLDYLVLIEPINNTDSKIWVSHVPLEIVEITKDKAQLVTYQTDRFYIYSCASLS